MDPKINIDLIIDGCLDGNPLSEKRLFDMHYNFVMSIVYRYTKNRVEAEEILNDTFYKVFKYLKSFNKEFPFTSWLNKITINACISYYKKHLKDFSTVDIELVPSSALRAHVEESVSLGEKYLMIIKQLPPAYRTVFNLYVFEDYKHSEIAELLHINIGTSKSNFKRAKDKVKEMLENLNSNNTSNDIADG